MILAAERRAIAPVHAASPLALPAWPLVVLVVGYPLEWALGLTAVGSIALGAVMALQLVVRGRVALVAGLLPLLAMVGWVVACAVNVQSGGQAIGYGQRLGDLIAAAVAAVYFVNARERVSVQVVVRALTVLWAVIVLLGLAAIVLPNLRLVSPMAFVVPQGLQSNDLVYQLLHPRLAEVQQPWGAIQPFNRPAAPFPYTNGWGAAYALLTPVVLARLASAPGRRERLTLLALLGASALPVIQSSNRGMLLGLAVAVGYVVVRLALRGDGRAAVAGIAVAGAGAAALVLSGALQGILARQEVSDSTGTRADLYGATFAATLDSPLLGWGGPQADATIGYALGTQGAAWTYMYSYGFVGLALFVGFLAGAVLRTAKAPSTTALWLHAVPVTALPLMWFYGLGTVQLIVLVLVCALLLRARSTGEVLA